MNKLYIVCAMLIPTVGCVDGAEDESSAFSGVGGVQQAGMSSNGGSVPGSINSTPGAGAVNAAGGSSTMTVGPGGCSAEVLPAAVQAMIASKCATCHGASPLPSLPSLVSYANLIAPSKSNPNQTNAVVALARLQSTTMPMPPAPGTAASASEIATLRDFISQGYPKASCPTGTGGSGNGGAGGNGNGGAGRSGSGGAGGSGNGGAGGSNGGAPSADPLNAMPICTSKTTWTRGNRGSASMNPGKACITCHKSESDAPSFSIAGTVFPTGHEPDLCNSLVGAAGARIVIIGADGKMLTLTPNAAGNFSSSTAVKTPYQAKVTYQGRERLMLTAQTSGDCNSCHTQNGSMMAPGRVTVP